MQGNERTVAAMCFALGTRAQGIKGTSKDVLIAKVEEVTTCASKASSN